MKRNTLCKRDYVLEILFWGIISFIWYQNLFFINIPGKTVPESNLILIVMVVVSVTANLVFTIRWSRNTVSAITATPCIAISNYNQKVAGVYEWIKYLPYVRYAEKLSDIHEVIKSIDTEAKYCFDTSVLNEYFWDMRNFLINF